ncbi:hypothetical protein M8C21_033175, partial [Ambrosia artemisiifolia]
DSKFEKDPLYEDLNAPQWIDLSSDDNPNPVDDEAWFCRPDCNHPKTVEDFFTPASSKLQRSGGVSEILGSVDHRNKRDPAALKKRGGFPSNKDSKTTKYVHDNDDENHNPNFSTPPPPPPMNKAKSLKEMIKSSSEKNHFQNVKEEIPQQPLKTTLSAHNLFTGRDIFNQVTDFCNELKRLAMMRRRTKDNGEKQEEMGGVFQRMPLLEMKKKYDEGTQNHNNVKKLTNKKLNVESENTPVSLNMKSIRSKEEKRLLQIRTNPPSPQCFSAKRKATPPTAFGFKPQERGTLEEIEGISSSSSSSKEVKGRTSQSQTSPLLKQNEAKGLDTKLNNPVRD